MSSKSTIAKVQGKSALRRTNIGPSQSIQALMVRIEWTDAKVVRIEARKDFVLQASTVQVKKGDYKVLVAAPVNIQKGMVIYFVASDEFEGYYYLNLYSEARSSFSCTCPKSAQFHQQCSHQSAAMDFVTKKYTNRIETEHLIDADLDIHISEELDVARRERQFENLASVA